MREKSFASEERTLRPEIMNRCLPRELGRAEIQSVEVAIIASVIHLNHTNSISVSTWKEICSCVLNQLARSLINLLLLPSPDLLPAN